MCYNISDLSCYINTNNNLLNKGSLENLKGFRIAHLNITLLPKYIDQLRLYLINKPVDILGINETRLDNSIDNAEVHIQGYNLYRKDRNRLGGGVAIYARDALNVKNMSQLVPISIEAVCVEVTKPKMKPFLITSIYCPPNSKVDFMDNLENYFNELDKQNSELIISGDLNCDLSISDLQPQSRRLMDIFQLFQLKQLIVEPTRITDDTETLLDIIATNRPDKVKDSGVIHLGISDHSLVYLYLKVSVPRDKPKIVDSRNLKYYSKESMNDHLYHELNNFSWEQTDPNILREQFKNIFNSVSDVHAPIKTRKVRSTYAPWLTTDIGHEMNQRDYLKVFLKHIKHCAIVLIN